MGAPGAYPTDGRTFTPAYGRTFAHMRMGALVDGRTFAHVQMGAHADGRTCRLLGSSSMGAQENLQMGALSDGRTCVSRLGGETFCHCDA